MDKNYENMLLAIANAEMVLVGIGNEFEGAQFQAEAYQVLEKLIGKKDYFIVSLCKDDTILQSSMNQEKLVKPCGGYAYLQCEDACTEQLYEAASHQLLQCPRCGKRLVFNNILAANYVEQGYLPQWKRYTEWLQGTLNKEICVLELGVGLEYPSVIRWPFEKIVFWNQKAVFYRIHQSLYQLSEEVSGRGTSVSQNALSFLLKKLSK